MSKRRNHIYGQDSRKEGGAVTNIPSCHRNMPNEKAVAKGPRPLRGQANDPFVGRFFHSIEWNTDTDGPPRREIAWQGVVVEKRSRHNYLVQLFEWLSGGPSDQYIVHRDEMTNWQFYGSDAEMRAYYEDYARRLESDRTYQQE